MQNNILENILVNKIKEFGNFLITICNKEDKKKLINETLNNLPLYKIMIFVMLLDKEKIDTQINDFIILYSINDTLDNRQKIKEYLNYYIEVKNILNNN